jgi:hypothetical protein
MSPQEFAALTKVEDPTLIGQKHAVKVDSVLYVSPAMYRLLTAEEGEAREKVIRAIKVIVKEPPRKRRKYPWQ